MNAVNVNPDMTTFVCGGCGFAQRKTPAGGELSGVCRLCVSVAGVVLLGERGNLYFCNKVITNALPRGVVTTVTCLCRHLLKPETVDRSLYLSFFKTIGFILGFIDMSRLRAIFRTITDIIVCH